MSSVSSGATWNQIEEYEQRLAVDRMELDI